MSDPFKKVRPDDPIQFSATAWNAMLDAGRAVRDGQNSRGGSNLTTTRSSALIRIRNDTGEPQDRTSILGIGGPIFDPTSTAYGVDAQDAFLREVLVSGVVPTSGHVAKFCVLLEPVLPNYVVRAWVTGVCQVMVNLNDPNDVYADVLIGETSMLNSGAGSAQILWCEADSAYGYTTGPQWALVRLGQRTETHAVGVVQSNITPATSSTQPGQGTWQRYTSFDPSGPTLGTLTGVNEPIFNIWLDAGVEAGATIQGESYLGSWWLDDIDQCTETGVYYL